MTVNLNDLFSLKGEVALVTGGSSGIGKGMVDALAAASSSATASSPRCLQAKGMARAAKAAPALRSRAAAAIGRIIRTKVTLAR